MLAATDVANHLSCGHLTTLNFLLATGALPEPTWDNPHLQVLRERGFEHEWAYKAHLRSKGLEIVDLSDAGEEDAKKTTIGAMSDGAQVIVQAGLGSGDWSGRSDILLRVDTPEASSRFGAWGYEVVDCKLASETKAETVLQLLLYSELVAEIQGVTPERFHVIRPNVAFAPESYRVSAYAAYYRTVKRDLQRAVRSTTSALQTYPEPVSHCEVCRWWKECDRVRRRDDHMCFVAGASRLQRTELGLHDVRTLESLAGVSLPLPFRPKRGAPESYVRIREQARIQMEARRDNSLRFEMLGLEAERGLCRLPEPSHGDIFLDFEGDPFSADGGLEYLFGIVIVERDETPRYQCRWVFNRAEERRAFEWLIDLVFEQMRERPNVHIYHYGAYEQSAIKRLVLRYATREEDVDRLLRAGVFIDLHSIVKQSLRAGVEQYSLKDMERFCGFTRTVPLQEATHARHVVEHHLQLHPGDRVSESLASVVERYNEDDCRATDRLRFWLESLRTEAVSNGLAIPRPAPKENSPSDEVTANQQRVAALFEALTKGLPEEPSERNEEQSARWLLAHALDWHRREDKVKWWEFYRLKDLTEEELFDEKVAIAGLSFKERLPPRTKRERAPIDRYEYPAQECSIRRGDDLHTQDEQKFGEVIDTDPASRTIDVKKPIKLDAFHPERVFAHSRYQSRELSASILRLADWIVAHGIDSPGEYRAARDLVLKNWPRLRSGHSLETSPGEDTVQAACRLGVALDQSVLPIQGPPGAGKTFTAARMICELVRQGKKVGITAVSHKVIRKVLDDVAKAAGELSVAGLVCGHKVDGADPESQPVLEIGNNDEALGLLIGGGVNVLGGTAWLWSREDCKESVDVLFVDEAGQMSLANVLACAPAGRSLVLLGDPQQLEQPQQGSHPEGSDISALGHLLGDRKTIGESQGIFLAKTWRLHPDICLFTSELFYEGRLSSIDGLERQRIDGTTEFAGSGLWFVAVRHEGNQSHSKEEIDRVAEIVTSLTQMDNTWTDKTGSARSITLQDVLIVAPYNQQVNGLTERLPGARIGTVDKFQGQEAPVVIFSMTTSSPEDAPRGMEFLYNLNRFNVGTSRARCICIVVGSPKLLSPECRTPRQMELANAICRYVELAKTIGLAIRLRAPLS